jgi:hypothetical protein
MSHTATSEQDLETEVLEPDWLAAPSRRSRSRAVLLVLLAVLLIFLGGVEVQKRWGAAGSASTSTGLGGLPTGGSFPSGGLGDITAGSGAPTQSDDGSDSPSAATTPSVIGTLTRIHSHTWTVKDLGGKSHTVKVSGKTTLTRPITDVSAPIHTGSSVTVTGTTHGRTVVATAVTVR